MIIQRISKVIKEQDWFVVMVEVMIVVVGIFIGLQVDDWNQDRKDHLEETGHLIQLSMDMMENDNILKVRIEEYSGPLEDMSYTAILLEKGLIPEEGDQKVRRAVQWITFLESLVLNLETYKTMVSTGAIVKLQNIALRRALLSLEQSLSYYREQLNYFRAFALNNYDDIKGVRTYGFNPEGLQGRNESGTNASFPLRVDMKTFGSDKKVKAAFINAFRGIKTFRDLNLNLREKINHINGLLKQELGVKYPDNTSY